MENKYYNPEIEEFNVGFEFESNYLKVDWAKQTLKLEEMAHFYDSYILDASSLEFRVKYLDREDIEDLGWNYTEDSSAGDGNIRWFDSYTIKGGFYKLNSFGHIPSIGDNLCDKVIIFSQGGENIIFEGKIKNKSELKKLLKQLLK